MLQRAKAIHFSDRIDVQLRKPSSSQQLAQLPEQMFAEGMLPAGLEIPRAALDPAYSSGKRWISHPQRAPFR